MATLFRVTDRKRRAVILASAAAAAIVTASGVANAADIIQYTPPPPTAAPIPVTPAVVPSFYLNVSALYMTRKNPAADALVIADDTLLDAADLDYNWRPGIQVRAGSSLGGGNLGFDIGGFWLWPMTAEANATIEATAGFIDTEPDDTVLAAVTQVDALGTTTFRGLDANLTYALGDGIRAFGGIAFMSLNDTLEMTVVDEAVMENYAWDVHNRLIGPQVGIAASLMGGGQGFFVDATARAGLMFNQITSTVESPAGTGDNIEKVRGLMLGGGVTAGYNFSENFGVTLGYQATMLRNVGLAPGQVATTGNLDQAAIPLETATDKFLVHGLTLGLNLAF